jgi:hypothetical protein
MYIQTDNVVRGLKADQGRSMQWTEHKRNCGLGRIRSAKEFGAARGDIKGA